MMIRLVFLLTSATINASTLPAAASECTSPAAIAAVRTHWAAARSQLHNSSDHDAACRAYAAFFYQSVTTRQTVIDCIGNADHDSEITALDSEISTFNDLLATKCGS